MKTGDISISQCRDPKKSGINTVRPKPITDLAVSVSGIPAELNFEDFVWKAGWIVKISTYALNKACLLLGVPMREPMRRK